MKNNYRRSNILSSLLCIVLALLLLVCVIFVIFKKKGEPPSIFGYKLYVVISDSMEPELKKGDLIVVKDIDTTKIEVGNIITFKEKNSQELITHRVVDIKKNTAIEFITKGDSNIYNDENKVKEEEVIGVVNNSINNLGGILEILERNSIIIILCIVTFTIMLNFYFNMSLLVSNSCPKNRM